MKIRLSEFETPRRPVTLLDIEIGLQAAPPVQFEEPFEIGESAVVALRVTPDNVDDFDVRLMIGNVVVASTCRYPDRPEFLIEMDDAGEFFRCRGRLFQNWVGLAELEISARVGDVWQEMCRARCVVTASKIEQDKFESLCAEIADRSVALLLDVYGKTYVGLLPERGQGELAPIALMERMAEVIGGLQQALRLISRRPAYRMKTTLSRVPVRIRPS